MSAPGRAGWWSRAGEWLRVLQRINKVYQEQLSVNELSSEVQKATAKEAPREDRPGSETAQNPTPQGSTGRNSPPKHQDTKGSR